MEVQAVRNQGTSSDAGRAAAVPITASQSVYAWCVRYPGSPAPCITIVLEIDGPLHREALANAVNELIARHAVLRARFSMEEGKHILMRVEEKHVIDVPVANVAIGPQVLRFWRARRLIRQTLKQRFDITKSPPLRALLIRRTRRNHDLVLVFHHIICDAWSSGIIIRELRALYREFLLSEPRVPPPPRLQYSDLARWQSQWVNTSAAQRHTQYWRKRLSGASLPFWLPADRRLLKTKRWSARSRSGILGRDISIGVDELCKRTRATPWMVTAACVAIVLREWSERDDVILRCHHSGRTRIDMIDLIGCLNQFWDLRIRIKSGISIENAIREARNAYVEALPHLSLPARETANCVVPLTRDNRGAPILFNYIPDVDGLYSEPNGGSLDRTSEIGDVATIRLARRVLGRNVAYRDPRVKLDLTFREMGGRLNWVMRYSRELFSERTIRWFIETFVGLMEQASAGRCEAAVVARRPGVRRRSRKRDR